MPVDDPAALTALLPHLASLLAEVPLDAPVAVGVSRPAPGDIELAFRHLDCTDVVCALGGFLAPAAWVAFGVIAPGHAAPVAPPTDRRAGHADHRDPDDRDPVGGVPVVACALVARDGGTVSEVRAVGDHELPHPIGTHPEAAGGPPQGRVIDTCRRVLGLPTDPPPFGPEVWRALAWTDRVLLAVLDADLGQPPAWPVLAALDLPVGPSTASWRALRRACRRGSVLVPGVDPATAAWMDDGMFAREAIGAFGPLAAVLGDLRGLLPPTTFDRVVERVSERLAA